MLPRREDEFKERQKQEMLKVWGDRLKYFNTSDCPDMMARMCASLNMLRIFFLTGTARNAKQHGRTYVYT